MTQALLPVVGRCNCLRSGPKVFRLRVLATGAEQVRQRLAGLDPDLPLATVQCQDCDGIVVLTLWDLHLVEWNGTSLFQKGQHSAAG